MASPTYSYITGTVPLPSGAAPLAAEITFTLSSFDTEGVNVIPPANSPAILDADGNLPAGYKLWRNTEGSRGTTYIVTAKWSERSRGMGFIPREQPLGKIQIGDADSYSLAELLDTTPPDVPVTGWFKAASAAEVQEIKDAADALSGFTAPGYLADVEAGVAATAADVITTGGNVILAQLAAAQAAMYVDIAIDTVDALLIDTKLTYSSTPSAGQTQVLAGQKVRLRETGISMVIAPALSALTYLSANANGVLFHPAPGTSPVMPEYWGGEHIGGSGENVTRHCQKLSAFVRAGLSAKVTLSPGRVYIVHGQDVGAVSGQPYYRSWGTVFDFAGVRGVEFDLAGAKLKTAPGLRYGSFHPTTGVRHDAPAGGFTNSQYAASIGRTIQFSEGSFCRIFGGELDGAMNDIIVGGYWGDTGIQTSHVGLDFRYSRFFKAEDVLIYDYGLDGVYITHRVNERHDGYFRNVRSYRNGRQGFSWTGGWGMLFEFCEFNDTGTGAIASAPRAGVDMEHNGQLVGDATYRYCKMKNNGGVDYLHPQTNDPGKIVFEHCEIGSARTTARPNTRSLWILGPGHRFYDCTIVGNCVNINGDTEFHQTLFTNKDWEVTSLLMDIDTPILLKDCEIHLYAKGGTTTYELNLRAGIRIIDTVFRFRATDPSPRSRLMYIGGESIRPQFLQEFTFTSTAARDAVTPVGEWCFVDSNSNYLLNSARFVGDAVAFASRTGTRNSILSAASGTYNGQDRAQLNTVRGRGVITLVDNTNGTFDLLLGTNVRGELLTIHGDSLQASGVLLRISTSSTAPANHQGVWILKSFAALGMTVEPAFVRVGSQDAIRFTEGTVPLVGMTFSVKGLSLGMSSGGSQIAPISPEIA